jgi:hypothetical protein
MAAVRVEIQKEMCYKTNITSNRNTDIRSYKIERTEPLGAPAKSFTSQIRDEAKSKKALRLAAAAARMRSNSACVQLSCD